jgi:ADP-heptose:LPS heptosyltransferase
MGTKGTKMIVIAPYAAKLRYGDQTKHPKEYPHWKRLLNLIKDKYPAETVIQVGVTGEQPLIQPFLQNLDMSHLKALLVSSKTWISVDSFLQHYGWYVGKKGIVLWGQSDPNIFGHPENVNLLKDRSFLREKQFWWWEQCEYRPEAFVEPEKVIEALDQFFVDELKQEEKRNQHDGESIRMET